MPLPTHCRRELRALPCCCRTLTAVLVAIFLGVSPMATSAQSPPTVQTTPASARATPEAEVIPATPTRWFNDYALTVGPNLANELNDRLQRFEHETTDQFLVVIFPKMQSSAEPADYCRRVFNAWGVGQKGVNNGVVLFVFLDDHKIRLSVGRGLETALSNAASQKIIDGMIPFFRKGDFEGGLSHAVDGVIHLLQTPGQAARPSP